MKKSHVLVVAIMLGIGLILIVSTFYDAAPRFDNDQVMKEFPIRKPIDSAREAVEVMKLGVDLARHELKIREMLKARPTAKFQGWYATADQTDSERWSVFIQSRGFSPPFRCSGFVNVNSKVESKLCRYIR